MLDIIAGEDEGSYAVVAGDGLPEHVSVVAVGELDLECYAEAELSDVELLELAAADAVEARSAGQLGGPTLDETALCRAGRRSRRRVTAEALRMQEVAA